MDSGFRRNDASKGTQLRKSYFYLEMCKMFARRKFQICLIAIFAVFAALFGTVLGEPLAYAQGQDGGYVDVALALEAPDDFQASNSHNLNIIVVNQGSRTAYDVEVVVDVEYPVESRFVLAELPEVPVGTASLDGTSLRWSIPALGRLQREEVEAEVTHKKTTAPAFDNTSYPHKIFGTVTTASFDNKLENNTSRIWSYDYSTSLDKFRQVAGNYSVAVSVDDPNPARGGGRQIYHHGR